MTEPDDLDSEPPSWAEHAEDLEGAQLALAMVRGYLSDDEADLDAVIAQVEEFLDLRGSSTGSPSSRAGSSAWW